MEHLEYLRKTVELSKRVEGNDWDGFRSWQGVYLELAKMECNKAGTGNRYALDYEIMDKGLDRVNNPAASNGASSLQRCRAAGYVPLAAFAIQ